MKTLIDNSTFYLHIKKISVKIFQTWENTKGKGHKIKRTGYISITVNNAIA